MFWHRGRKTKYDETIGGHVAIKENNDYLYQWDDESGRTAPTQIGKTSYMYDGAGNPTVISGDAHNDLKWDCQNRLRQIDAGQIVHNYYYDHSGERALKRFGNSTKVGVDAGDSQSVTDDADGYSAYFSPYFVETQGGRYTKHYYAGTQRMASMVDVMQKGMGEEPEQASEEEKDALKDCQKMQQMKVPGYDAGGAGKADAEAAEPALYFYHTDHLGSTSIITDRSGDVGSMLPTPRTERRSLKRRVLCRTSSTARN